MLFEPVWKRRERLGGARVAVVVGVSVTLIAAQAAALVAIVGPLGEAGIASTRTPGTVPLLASGARPSFVEEIEVVAPRGPKQRPVASSAPGPWRDALVTASGRESRPVGVRPCRSGE